MYEFNTAAAMLLVMFLWVSKQSESAIWSRRAVARKDAWINLAHSTADRA